MKICTKCNKEKNEFEFDWKNKSKGIRHIKCKPCMKIYRKFYYETKDKEKQKKRVYESKKKFKKKFKLFKDTLYCESCGENAVECLDFHHIDPTEKKFSIGNICKYQSVKMLAMEIEKCAVLCSNCHRKVHAGNLKCPITVRDMDVLLTYFL